MFELGFQLLYGAELLILLKTIVIAFKKNDLAAAVATLTLTPTKIWQLGKW